MTAPLSVLVVEQNPNMPLWLKHCIGDEEGMYHGRRITLETATPYDAVKILEQTPYHLVVMTYDFHEETFFKPSKFDILFNSIRTLYSQQKILLRTTTKRKPKYKADAGTRCIPKVFNKKQAKSAVEKLLNGTLDDVLMPTKKDLPEEAEKLRITSFSHINNF